MKSITVDWWDERLVVEIDFTCPHCHGEGTKEFEDLTDDELSEVRAHMQEDIDPEDAGNVEDEEALADYYRDEYDYKPCCDECTEGQLEPMMNYAYPVYCSFDEENRRKASENGLFLFEMPGTRDVYMSLMGGGMDLTPSILRAYLDLQGYIPEEWAMELQQDYWFGDRKEEVAKACLESLRNRKRALTDKIKALRFMLEKPKEYKKAKEKQQKEFEKGMKKVKALRDDKDLSMLAPLVGVSEVLKATKDVLPEDE